MVHEVIHNFLPDEDFQIIKSVFTGPNISWYYKDGLAYEGDQSGAYFNHCVYGLTDMTDTRKVERATYSDFFNLLQPIYDRLDIKVLMRVKANMYHATESLVRHSAHVDEDFSHNLGIFSLNTCDGYTELDDGTKISSVENTMLLCDGGLPHRSTTTTDAKMRWNIGVNWL